MTPPRDQRQRANTCQLLKTLVVIVAALLLLLLAVAGVWTPPGWGL